MRTIITLLLVATASAQSTWIVDASGGGQFVDIPPAIAAASPGDRIVVRPGLYSSFSVSKGVTIVGDGATLMASDPTIAVRGLPATETCAIAGFQAESGYYGQGMSVLVRACAGRVHLQRLESGRGYWAGLVPVLLTIEDSAAVSANEYDGPRTVGSASRGSVVRSTVRFENCRFAGLSAGTCGPGATEGLRLVDSDVVLHGGSVTGGGGNYTYSCGGYAPAPAVWMTRGVLRINGRATLTANGAGGFGGSWRAPAIFSDAGRVEIDPRVQLLSSASSPTSGTSSFATVPILGTNGLVTHQGAMLEVQVTGDLPIGSVVALLVGAQVLPVTTPFRSLWIDPRWSFELGRAVVTTVHPAVWFRYPLVPQFSAPGTGYAFQGAAVDPSGQLMIATPAAVTIQ